MIRLYRRVSGRCHSVNQLNLLHITLENRMTPCELLRLHAETMAQRGWGHDWSFWPVKTLARKHRRHPRLLAFRGFRDERHHEHRLWVNKLLPWFLKSGKPLPEPFERRCFLEGVSFYTAGGARADKTLLVCFTGASGRPMLPLPVFLQHLDAQRTDLLLLRYPRGPGFRQGLRSLGDTLEASIDRLGVLMPTSDYRRVVALGTSGGGLPALLTATRLGFDAALCVGASHPDDLRWQAALGERAGAVLSRYAGALTAAPALVLVCGCDHAVDKAATTAIAGLLPADLVEVDNPLGKVGHNPLMPLMKRGELRALLDASLFASSGAPTRSANRTAPPQFDEAAIVSTAAGGSGPVSAPARGC